MTIQLLTEFFEKRETGVLSTAQKAAWSRFLSLGLPTKKTSGYKYVTLPAFEPRLAEDDHLQLRKSKQSTLLFVNGRYHESLSNLEGLPRELVVLPLTKAWKTFGSYLQGRYLENLKHEMDPFATLNGALCEEGAFLYLPPHTKSETVLDLVRLTSREGFSLPRLHIYLGKGAHLKLQLRDLGGCGEISAYTDIVLEEGAHLSVTAVIGPELPTLHLESVRVLCKRHSHFEQKVITAGCKTFRHDSAVTLAGEGAEAKLWGLSTGRGKNEAHFHVRMEHLAPHTHSEQLYKNVLQDSSRASFEGKIFVAPEAQKTQAYQMNPNLVLSDRALAVSLPNLEIFADDVKASHGSTIGKLDEEHLFYLKTRGMTEERAKSLLIQGFCQQILNEVEDPSLHQEALSLVTL